MNKKVVPILLAFLCMGFGDAVGPFVGLAKAEFELSNFMAMIIPFMGFIMFGLLSVPMGIFQDKHSKKTTLIVGLVIALIGLAIPIFGLSHFFLFLLTVLLLGAGATILQVAGNPIMRDVSLEGKYSRNLSIGQFVKAIGSLAGPIIPAVAAAWFGADWKVIFPIFVGGILITLFSVLTTNVEESKEADKEPTTFSSSLSLLSNKYVAMMVFGIFIYVGAEVCMSSGIPLYLEDNFGVNIERMGVLGTGLFFTTLMIGRFLGGVILNWIKPQKFFIITTILAVIGILGLFVGTTTVAIISVIVIGLSFANVFPLIFSITVDHMPEKTNELSGLMVTAIVGGALVPPLMGFIQDLTTVSIGFLVPLAAFVYITYVAIKNLSITEVE
ncbi:MAG TPA: MFS transporter [bacterium]|nr:MFS transporter [bacterium]